jgi:1-acyl-sn-glycerol-3-phosphate acyltransferase
VEVVGREHLPATGPVIVAANHQNALVDPMLLLATLPRRLCPIAKAPLFRHPVIAPFLHLLGALPVERRQDPGSDTARNQHVFAAVARRLRTGGGVLIFPEGVSQAEPVLQPLRTGTARMLLLTESAPDGPAGVTLLPVGLVFHEPATFRTGRALVLIGEPVPTADLVALARAAPEVAARLLTERLAGALRGLVVEADDRETLRLARVVEAVWREENPAAEGAAADGVAWLRRLLRAYRYLAEREPTRVEGFRREVERYAKDLESAGLEGSQLGARYPRGAVSRYAAREGLSLLLGLPLALWGMAVHGVPYGLTALAVRIRRPTPDEAATVKLAAGVILYPLCWLAEAWVAWRLGGGWLLGALVLSLAPSGFFALTWRERLDRVRRDALGYLRFLADRDLLARLAARRRALLAELTVLAHLVPESALAGEPGAERPA